MLQKQYHGMPCTARLSKICQSWARPLAKVLLQGVTSHKQIGEDLEGKISESQRDRPRPVALPPAGFPSKLPRCASRSHLLRGRSLCQDLASFGPDSGEDLRLRRCNIPRGPWTILAESAQAWREALTVNEKRSNLSGLCLILRCRILLRY